MSSVVRMERIWPWIVPMPNGGSPTLGMVIKPCLAPLLWPVECSRVHVAPGMSRDIRLGPSLSPAKRDGRVSGAKHGKRNTP